MLLVLEFILIASFFSVLLRMDMNSFSSLTLIYPLFSEFNALGFKTLRRKK